MLNRFKLTIFSHILFLMLLGIFNYAQYISLKQSSIYYEKLSASEVRFVSSQLEAMKDLEEFSILFDQNENFQGNNLRPLKLVKLKAQAIKTSYQYNEPFDRESALKSCWVRFEGGFDVCTFVPETDSIAGAVFIAVKFPKLYPLDHTKKIPLTYDSRFEITLKNDSDSINYKFLVSTGKAFGKSKDAWENKVIATKPDGISPISNINGSIANLRNDDSSQVLLVRIVYEEINPDNGKVWPPKNYKDTSMELKYFKAGDRRPNFSNTIHGFADLAGISSVNRDSIDNAISTILGVSKSGPSTVPQQHEQGIVKRFIGLTFLNTVNFLGLNNISDLNEVPIKIGDYKTMSSTYHTSPLRISHDNRLKEILAFTALENIVLISFYFLVSFVILRKVRKLTKEVIDVSTLYADDSSNAFAFKYADANNEIGILTREFSELIEKLRKTSVLEKNRISAEISQREFTLRQIGHEIKSPMQALIALGFTEHTHTASKYLIRMDRAISHLMNGNVLSAMPIDSSHLDLVNFFREIEAHAHLQNIEDVVFTTEHLNIYLNVDAAALEDAITHILNNAMRFKFKNADIVITLRVEEYFALCRISNKGPLIPPEKLEEIFEYGISTSTNGGEHLGQGLFVAKDYITRMGGTIHAYNTDDEVVFEIKFPIVE